MPLQSSSQTTRRLLSKNCSGSKIALSAWHWVAIPQLPFFTSTIKQWSSRWKNHMRLLSAQFLARALHSDHPSHHHVKQDQGPRPMKQTLRSKILDDVRPYLDADGNVAPGDFQRVKAAIHTDVVATTIGQLSSSRVLNARPPPVDKSETSLPRLVRTTLSHLLLSILHRQRGQ